jgi:hypothetical protein
VRLSDLSQNPSASASDSFGKRAIYDSVFPPADPVSEQRDKGPQLMGRPAYQALESLATRCPQFINRSGGLKIGDT